MYSVIDDARHIDGAIDHRLDPNSEQRRRTLACARPKQDPPTRTFELAAESDYTLPTQEKKKKPPGTGRFCDASSAWDSCEGTSFSNDVLWKSKKLCCVYRGPHRETPTPATMLNNIMLDVFNVEILNITQRRAYSLHFKLSKY